MIMFARANLQAVSPSCFEQLDRDIDYLFQLAYSPADRSVIAIHGLRDRDWAERCIAETYEAVTSRKVTLTRDGHMTEATSARGSLFLAWSPDGWLYAHPDRTRAQALLSRPAEPTLSPALFPYFSKLTPQTPWVVYPRDVTSSLMNVPSSGFTIVANPGHKPRPQILVSLTFNTKAAARRFVEILKNSSRDSTIAPALRSALPQLTLTILGDVVEIDPSPLLADPAALESVGALLKARLDFL